MTRQPCFNVISVLVLLLTGCGHEVKDKPIRLASANHLPHQLMELPFEQRPNRRVDVNRSESYIEPLDEDSVEMFHYRGYDYYQPVGISQACHVFVATYVETGVRKYLDRAERYIGKLMSQCYVEDSIIWAPYEMVYAVHGDSANKLAPPWYSGMAQGEILTVLSRLYEFTDKPEYLEQARGVFNSFAVLRGESDRWVAQLDTAGYYWIEEYPHDDLPGRTLNGFITAVGGIYEYYLVSQDPRAKLIYDLSLTTLRNYVPAFRRPGQNSLYCLGHQFAATDGYHALHVRQLRELYRLSGDSFYLMAADAFENDPVTATEDTITSG